MRVSTICCLLTFTILGSREPSFAFCFRLWARLEQVPASWLSVAQRMLRLILPSRLRRIVPIKQRGQPSQTFIYNRLLMLILLNNTKSGKNKTKVMITSDPLKYKPMLHTQALFQLTSLFFKREADTLQSKPLLFL